MQENIFWEIKSRVAMADAARFYGLQIDRGGMACCPFHGDKKPSLKIYPDNFYCFGCGASGDATGFVAKLFGISQYQAAKKISYDFGLRLFDRDIAVSVNARPDPEREYKMWLIKAEKTISEYLNALCRWNKEYRPRSAAEQPHPRFSESLTQMGYAEYVFQTLRYGSEQDKRLIYKNDREYFSRIQNRLECITPCRQPVKRRVI